MDGACDVMRFEGVRAPALDAPLIELETPEGELVDLYNECLLESVALRGDVLVFAFVSVAEGTPIVLRFERVRDLRVLQPQDWVPQEASQIDHLLIRSEGPWRGVVFKAGGLEYEFDCAALVFG